MHRSHTVWFIFSVSIFLSAVKADQGEFSIEDTLKNTAFNTRRMPPEQMLISRYGKGKRTVGEGCVYHTYYLPNLGLWLRCQGDAEDRLYTPISEILISGTDLGTRIPSKTTLIDPNLKGIRVGEDIQRALDQWGEPLRRYPAKLGGVRAIAYEFFPATLGPGLCVRFFARNRKVVAFSFSSEE
jgi:hypothetical protein